MPGKFSLYKLHEVIQVAMGWTDSHLHMFIINGEFYSIPSREDFEPTINERRHTLNEIAGLTRKFIYEYEFTGDLRSSLGEDKAPGYYEDFIYCP